MLLLETESSNNRNAILIIPIYTSVLQLGLLNDAKDNLLLEKVQRRVTRMIPRLKNVLYEKRLKELRLWSLEDRRIRADLIEVFKMDYHRYHWILSLY